MSQSGVGSFSHERIECGVIGSNVGLERLLDIVIGHPKFAGKLNCFRVDNKFG